MTFADTLTSLSTDFIVLGRGFISLIPITLKL